MSKSKTDIDDGGVPDVGGDVGGEASGEADGAVLGPAPLVSSEAANILLYQEGVTRLNFFCSGIRFHYIRMKLSRASR